MKRWYDSTFLRYFMSYFIVILVMMTGFIFVIRSQMVRTCADTLDKDVKQRLVIVQEQLKADLTCVYRIDRLLRDDIILLDYRYGASVTHEQQLYKFMCNLVESNGFIESIIYLNKNTGGVVSTKYVMKYEEGLCQFNLSKIQYETFNLYEAEENIDRTLFFVGGSSPCFVYTSTSAKEEYAVLYTIDESQLTKILSDNVINGMEALVLINKEDSCIYGVHTEKIVADADSIPEESGIYQWNEEDSLYVYTDIYEKYTLVALISGQYVTAKANVVISTAYVLLAVIGLVGFLLIFLGMKLTYLPLAKLIRKVVPVPENSENYIVQLESAFDAAATEIERLQNKINKYHLSIQKSLLESGIEKNVESSIGNIKNIDQIFRAECENYIYMLRVHFDSRTFPEAEVEQFLKTELPGDSAFIILERGTDYRVFVMNCIACGTDGEEGIYVLLERLYREQGCFCALSDRVSSLIDIPSLYEKTLQASRCWPDIPVAVYSRIIADCPKTDNEVYPYKLLGDFNESLERMDFTESAMLLNQLLFQIQELYAVDSKYPDYIIRCLLIDILMALFSSMNQRNVKYDIYKDLYYETLYYCRSCGWQEKKQEITYNLQQLLELFREEQSRIRANQIREYLEQNYTLADLDITMMADYFHVNSVYMSWLIKKELGETFVNYVWNLRFQKAKELLVHTDLSIDTISNRVGYENTSSFRRKFKQETGLTPSQFRNGRS